MRVALVYDRVNKWGGAERVLMALRNVWPEAPLFTAVYDRKNASWADVFEVRPSFLNRIPFASRMHESLPLLTPLAFESFSFDGFDVVISVTSAEAKNIITKPGTTHICYCLTPTRYLWSGYGEYVTHPGLGGIGAIASLGLRMFAPTLREWDRVAASRPDYYLAISDLVKRRIETYYGREVSAVIRPPVRTSRFRLRRHAPSDGYYLTVSRLVGYKRLDLLVEAFNRLGYPLVIVGDGRQKRELRRLARHNIRFVDRHLTDSELLRYYEGCRAFVFAGEEDFGLAAIEAQAVGVPVIAYQKSGLAELVSDGVTGLLFDRQTPEAIVDAVKKSETLTFSPEACRTRAELADERTFIKRMREVVAALTTKKP